MPKGRSQKFLLVYWKTPRFQHLSSPLSFVCRLLSAVADPSSARKHLMVLCASPMHELPRRHVPGRHSTANSETKHRKAHTAGLPVSKPTRNSADGGNAQCTHKKSAGVSRSVEHSEQEREHQEGYSNPVRYQPFTTTIVIHVLCPLTLY